jgi:hypothetical protein
LENELFGLVALEFPNYEIFWQRYVVPCTNRINPNAVSGDIRLRSDAKRFEKMVMSHYSVFSYFVRATRRLKNTSSDDELANIVFFLLNTSIDNLEYFLEEVKDFLADCGLQTSFGQPRNDNESIRHITDYRGALTHLPVIGRAVNDQGMEMLPIHSVLDKVKDSWLKTQELTESEFRETRVLIEELRSGYAAYLNKKWADVLEHMEKKRDKFLSLLRIPDKDVIVPMKVISEILPHSAYRNATMSSHVSQIGGMTVLDSSATWVPRSGSFVLDNQKEFWKKSNPT